jgi:hypothetical protein
VASSKLNGLASAENRIVGNSVGQLVSKSGNLRHMKKTRSMAARSADLVDEHVLMPEIPDDSLERAGGGPHNQALTLGFCTFNLLECPIGSRT